MGRRALWACTWHALRSDKHTVETKWGRRDSAIRSLTSPLELHWRPQVLVTHNCSIDAVIILLCLHIDLSEFFMMSLLLYHALTAHPQRLNVLFFSFRFVYTATSKSCCWDYSVLLVFLPRSLAFVRRLFLVRCQTDHKKLEHLLLYNSKRHSSLKPICNYAPLRYACIAELQDPELCWVRQCLVWV